MNELAAAYARHRDQMDAAVPAHLERLRWSREQIERHQLEQLRRLLQTAMASSPFQTRRLRGIDPERFDLADWRRCRQ
jgi:phenylacetate-coenzyme A ligase PaaK-like adenylate-forming protein